MREHIERSEATGNLAELEHELSKWRRTHHAPTPLPEDCWQRAAVLGAQLGVGVVARRLRLNAAHLKRRVDEQMVREAIHEPGVATFIELLSPVSTSVAECAMEVESPRGTRMRLVMKDVPAGYLAYLLREFAG